MAFLKLLVRALKNGLAFRKLTGELSRAGSACVYRAVTCRGQTMMAANAPMIQEAMVRGQPDNGILPSGQVAGIDDLPSVSTLMERIKSEANTRARQIASLSGGEDKIVLFR